MLSTLNSQLPMRGRVIGFGRNTAQFIDLTAVASAGGVSLSYTSNTSSSGVLTVSSSGSVVASINFSGSYTTSSFHLTSGAGGTVEIFDPPAGPQKDTELATDSKTPPASPDPFIAGSSRSNDDLAGMHWPDALDTMAGVGSTPQPDPTPLKYEPKDQTISMFSWDHGGQSQVSTQLSEVLLSFAPVAPENLLFGSPGSIDQPTNRTNDIAKFTEFLASWDQGRSQAASNLFSTTSDSRNSFAQDDQASHPFVAASGRP